MPQPTPAPTRLQMPAGSLPSVTTFQWRAFQAWVADSSFDLDWANAPATTSPLDVPAEITRAHLATAAGGHFVPGVEAGNIVTAAGTWALKAAPGMAKPGWDDAFRVDTSRIAAGDATQAEVKQLEMLCDMVKHTSLCGLGQSAPNPVLSTLRYFRPEYDQSLKNGRMALPTC